MAPDTSPLSRRLVGPAFAIAAIGASLYLGLTGWQPGHTFEFPGLVAAAMLASALRLQHCAAKDWTVTPPSFVVDFTALLLLGPQTMLLVAGAGVVMQALTDPESEQPYLRLLINAVTVLAAAFAAASAHQALGGTIGTFKWPDQGAPIAAAVVAYFLVKSLSAEIIVPLLSRQPIDRSWPANLLRGGPGYFIGAGLAVGVVALVGQRAWEVIPVAAVPLFFAYRACSAHVAWLTEQRRAESAIQAVDRGKDVKQVALADDQPRSDDRLALAAEAANDGLWEWDLQTNEFYCSSRWRSMLGMPASAGTGPIADWFARVHKDDRPGLKAALEAYLAGKAEQFQFEHRLRHEDGTYRPFVCRGLAARGADRRAVRIAGSLTDMAAPSRLTERPQNAGFLDPLTGLGNRAVFVEGLGKRLKEFKSGLATKQFAALYLDLDRFKVVNDNLGHPVGDELLTAVSRRLESCLRAGDALARLGGDEFAVLLNELGDVSQANVIAFRIQEALSAPFSIGGREVFTSASIGIACGQAQYMTPDEMMRDADTAMYHAKSRGKARHEMFDADMHARELDRVGLENDLRHAVNTNGFELHYQPIVLLGTGMCVGFESLARWTRNGKPVSPAVFIPLAEELGIIEPVGTWALQLACTTFADWKRRFPAAGLDYITVNVSSRQLMQDNFLRLVEQAVEKSGLKPRDLRLEITETALMNSPVEAAKLLRELREFGAKIYLDDFGCGYSSLSHLATLPVDVLKIDRSFVKNLLQTDRPAIVESILALARTLKTGVVAEGIEQEVQGRELERLGCTHAQGYLYSRPVSAEAAEAIIAAGQPLGPKRLAPRDALGATAGHSSGTFEWPDDVLVQPRA